jgi:integrase
MKTKLDTRSVAAAQLPSGKTDELYWDTELSGFGYRLRRGADGGLLRSFVAQYRAGGRARRFTVGDADKISAPQAREAARKLLARVELGHDPQAEKVEKRRRDAHTTKSVVEDYLAAKQSELRPQSFRVKKLYLTGPYFRALHPLAVTDVTRSDVARCVRDVARRHGQSTAAAARRALSSFFAWAVADGLLGDGANPVEGSHQPDEPPSRDRVLTDAELATVWKEAGDDEFGRIVRLLVLLGNRRQEVGGMRRSELDLDAGTWSLPAERVKNKRAVTVHLPPAALDIIRAVPVTTRDCLFGVRAAAGFTAWDYGKAELDRRLAERAENKHSVTVRPWKLHDLRRTAATGMASIGIEPHHIEACLNHYSGHRRGVAGVYNRSPYERAVKAALARWSEHVLALVEGRADKVVSLRKRG